MNLFVKVLPRVVLILVLAMPLAAQGFLKVSGKNIVNGAGQNYILKGVGFGGWLLQEGYMLHTSAFANAQWQIRAKITDLIGEENTETFYETYRNNYVKKVDIDSLKAWGFNSIRLPFHYNLFATNTNPPVFLQKGFDYTDSLLAWCKANQMYLILDMHGAPGGQSDQPISDYNPAFPSLWESEQNKDLTVKIWRKLAEKYKDEEWIGGYDLLNEPKWDLGTNNVPLRDLYIRLTDTIRAVDTNHILYIEGNWYATDFAGLTPPWDANMVYSFHKYWNTNNTGSIQYLLDLRNNSNRPLWLGETGENSNQWLSDFVELMHNNNIGWATWPHKKIKSIAGPLSATLSPLYQTLLNYWNGSGSRPTATYAQGALMAQANALKLEMCTYNKDYVYALFKQPFSTVTVPFAENLIPGTIYAPNYDMGKQGVAYSDVAFQNTNNGTTYNSGYNYRNDGVDIEQCSDFSSNGFDVGWIENNEWLSYTVQVQTSGVYSAAFNVAAQSAGGQIFVMVDGQGVSFVNIPATGGWQNWQNVILENINLTAGTHKLTLRFYTGNFNLSNIDFTLISTDIEDETQLPVEFDLSQNHPNPFNPSTVVKYSLPVDGFVNISVYNNLGEKVSVLVDGEVIAGKYSVSFDAGNLPSGVYFCRMESGNFISSRKMLLLK
ncbi:MAG: cellulase family glycosylhydrolase [Ignavibacteriales bacterium]|nr:cellulase family glycosylhydrolase [Ignavibacteriales bacterium]